MFRLVAGELIPDSVKNAAQSATNTVSSVANAVQDGAQWAVSSASQAAASAVGYFAPPSNAQQIGNKYTAQKLNVPVKQVIRLTEEERWRALQLYDFRAKVRAHVSILQDEEANLKESFFVIVHKSEIKLKHEKWVQLYYLSQILDWQSFQTKAKELLENRTDVTAGRKSRTKLLLKGIAEAKFAGAKEDNQNLSFQSRNT